MAQHFDFKTWTIESNLKERTVRLLEDEDLDTYTDLIRLRPDDFERLRPSLSIGQMNALTDAIDKLRDMSHSSTTKVQVYASAPFAEDSAPEVSPRDIASNCSVDDVVVNTHSTSSLSDDSTVVHNVEQNIDISTDNQQQKDQEIETEKNEALILVSDTCDEEKNRGKVELSLINELNMKGKKLSREDEKRNAKVRYVFSIVPDKKSIKGRVVVCHCSACNDTIEVGSYPRGAELNGISNVNKHRDTTIHKFFVENAAGRKGKNNTVAVAMLEAAESYAGKDGFPAQRGWLLIMQTV